MKTLKTILSVLDDNCSSYTNSISLDHKYIQLRLQNGVVLDFSLGGVFNGIYRESKLKRASYMGKMAYTSNVTITDNEVIVNALGIRLPLFDVIKA